MNASAIRCGFGSAGGAGGAFNLGQGRGYSVREVIRKTMEITGRPIQVRTAARRPGDPPVLVASNEKARRELGWHPRVGKEEGVRRLVDWVIANRALFDAWERQDSHITRETLRRHELSNRRLKKILDEIKLGEKALEDIGDEVLARGMGMASTPSLDSADPDTALSRTPSKIKKKGTRVGKRAPSRDPVGGSVDAST